MIISYYITMKFRGAVFVALGLLSFFCSGSSAVDCSRKDSIESEQHKCFSRFGLDLGVRSDQIQNAIQSDPETVCQHPGSYKAGMRCAMDVSKSCLQQLGQSAAILPDVDSVIHGVTYLCDNMRNMDTQCAKNRQSALQECARKKTMSVFYRNSNLDVAYITCKAFEITIECMEVVLTSCAQQTKDVFVHFTQEYLVPQACRTTTGVAYGVTTLAPVTPFHLATWEPIMSVSCFSQSSIQASQQECFRQEGISVELPVFHSADGMQTKQSYQEAILSNNHDLHPMCRQLSKYQRAMGCAMDVSRQCMPDGYKDYLITAQQAHMMLVELCENVDDVNQECVASKVSDLFDCGYKYGQQIETRDIKTVLCLAFKFNVKCHQEVLPPCGYRTVRLFTEIGKKYLNPPACPAIGMATHSIASAGLLTMAAFLACLLSM